MVISVLQQILNPQMLLLVLGGVFLGVVLGAIPGLSGTIGIALLLPITFKMQPAQAILMHSELVGAGTPWYARSSGSWCRCFEKSIQYWERWMHNDTKRTRIRY